MACGEVGSGRMAEPHEILAAIEALLDAGDRPLAGLRAVVTSGPTREPLDPVRYLSNHSSGRQGHAIARALAEAGAAVTLVSGPVQEPDPAGVAVVRVETARRDAGRGRGGVAGRHRGLRRGGRRLAAGPVPAGKIKKREGEAPPAIELVENPDILRTLATRRAAPGAGDRLRRRDRRPGGQGAGEAGAQGLRLDSRQRCLARDGRVRRGHQPVLLLTGDGPAEAWPELDKLALAPPPGGADRRPLRAGAGA